LLKFDMPMHYGPRKLKARYSGATSGCLITVATFSN